MIKFADIEEAYKRIYDQINHTPVLQSRTLNSLLDAHVYFKCENYQRVGAFKFRGAINAISQLNEHQKKKGVITHSSGNHAQALALAAKILNVSATIVMPKGSPQVKINATQDTYGAKVVLCENNVRSRQETCQKIQDQEGQTLIHPYDNDQIIAGAGTAALELLDEIPDLDIIITPVGGGGLLSGTCIAAKGFNPKIKIYAGEPKLADDAFRSLKSGNIEVNSNPSTIADGLRTNLCARTFEIIKENVEEIILVSEEEILDSMKFIWERMKVIIEPSSAVPLASLMRNSKNFAGKKIGVILSGGNIDLTQFFSILKDKITKN